MNFVDIYQKYWKNGYTLTDLSLSGIDREVFRSLFNPVAEVFRKYPAGDVHLYIPGVGQVQGLQPGNYFDSDGTTQASVDGSVGMVLDAAGSVGAELQPPSWLGYNADLSSFNSFPTTATSGSAGNYGIRCPAALPTNKNLRVTVSWSGNTSGRVLKADAGGVTSQLGSAVSGTASYVFNSGANPDHYVYAVGAAAAGESFTITSASIKEVTGIHATQSTPGYKPTLRKGIVNLLTYSNDLTNAVWVKTGASTPTANSVSLPADYVGNVRQSKASVQTGVPITAAFLLSGTPGVQVSLSVYDEGGSYGNDNGTVVLSTTPTVYVVTRTNPQQTTVSARITAYGTATTVTIGGIGLFQGTLTAQQIIAAGGIPLTTTAPASSQAGVNYAEFDGVDDNLQLPSPIFQQADNHCVIVAASPSIIDGTYRRIFTQENGSATAAEMGYTVVGVNVTWRDNTPTAVSLVGPVPTLNTPFVFSARKIGDTRIGRFNGVEFGSNTTPLGATTLNPVAYFGNRAAMDRQFKGKLFPAIIIKGTVSDADLAVLEKFVAQLSGVTL